MLLEKDIQKIKDFLLKRYGTNLATILIFGSANTGHYIEGKSDIDHIILLKKLNGLDVSQEMSILIRKLKSFHFAIQYLNDLEGIKNYINKRKSFSTYITLVSEDGAKVIYTTSEFEKTRKYLKEHPLAKRDIKEQLKEKDKFELEGYFKEIKGANLTKALMAHLRRKLQIINYFQTGKLTFDYERCLNTIKIDKRKKEQLEKVYSTYSKRKDLTKGEVNICEKLARELTQRIIKI